MHQAFAHRFQRCRCIAGAKTVRRRTREYLELVIDQTVLDQALQLQKLQGIRLGEALMRHLQVTSPHAEMSTGKDASRAIEFISTNSSEEAQATLRLVDASSKATPAPVLLLTG